MKPISFNSLPYRKGTFIVDLKLLLGIKITLPAADDIEMVVIFPSNKIEMRINCKFLSWSGHSSFPSLHDEYK